MPPDSGYTELANSTFMDFASWRSNASGPSGGVPITGPVTLNVALVLDRATDPTALLQSDWATRQKELKSLNDSGTLWTTYGADPTRYAGVLTALDGLGIKTVGQISLETGVPNGYVSSAESRTVWVQVTQDSFSTLFGSQAKLMADNARGEGAWWWNGNLSLPTDLASLGVSGIWFDEVGQFTNRVANPGAGRAVDLPQHWQSAGNASTNAPNPFPQEIGDYYHLPLGSDVPTSTIGLVEPGVGTALPSDDAGSDFQAALDAYRHEAGVPTGASVISVAGGGQQYPIVPPGQPNSAAGERSLDVGVVSTVAPNSPLVVYAGSGYHVGALGSPYTAYQSAFWDRTNNPHVISVSPQIGEHVAPGSPFYKATAELFVDAALRNIAVFVANGDGGSSGEFGNGLTNTSAGRSIGYTVMVGGTSLSTLSAAAADATLGHLVELARAGDLATIWELVAAGMTESPVHAPDGRATFVETIWNDYYVDGTTFGGPGSPASGYQGNNAGAGGVDPSQPTPQYQTDYGLSPITSDPDHLPGRGTPDVSANAGGNMFWAAPGDNMIFTRGRAEGTSAAAPFWAAFGAQLDTVFIDQGLPHLGYMTDLLYIASAIAPATFNDLTIGNNTSSFVLGGSYTSDSVAITPTGYGYEAGPGYDLVSGLGTPNGMLLARALTQIGHHQMNFSDAAPLIEGSTADGWSSATQQTLLIQATAVAGVDASLTLGREKIALDGAVADSFAWTTRFAQQSLQPDFDPNLVRMFDKQAQGWVGWQEVAGGTDVSATIGQVQGLARQANLTSPYGLADFSATDGSIHLARAVAVAETAGGANDQNVVVRVRQNGEDNLSVSFYRVDDLTGAIGALKPGDAGYAVAAAGRIYDLQAGGSALHGPGYGLFAQAQIAKVDAGDLIAMQLTNHTTGDSYFAFGQANSDKAAHIVNYGLNTWGWEDLRGSGDRDFNDLVVQLDFTSASGNGWLI